ncbi:hypothetical protein BD560DRAFT_367562, partial [Blakeslea trispora]
FRILHDKFHCQDTITLFLPDALATCLFYHNASKSRHHLLVEYPPNWAIWQIVLRNAFHFLEFSPPQVIAVLCNLQSYAYAPSTTLFTPVCRYC